MRLTTDICIYRACYAFTSILKSNPMKKIIITIVLLTMPCLAFAEYSDRS